MAFTLRQQRRERESNCPILEVGSSYTSHRGGGEGARIFLGSEVGSVGESPAENILHPPKRAT